MAKGYKDLVLSAKRATEVIEKRLENNQVIQCRVSNEKFSIILNDAEILDVINFLKSGAAEIVEVGRESEPFEDQRIYIYRIKYKAKGNSCSFEVKTE